VRAPLLPSGDHGLRELSSITVDKVTTVPPTGLRERISKLTDQELLTVHRSLLVFLYGRPAGLPDPRVGPPGPLAAGLARGVPGRLTARIRTRSPR
jgi:hypothetical protein